MRRAIFIQINFVLLFPLVLLLSGCGASISSGTNGTSGAGAKSSNSSGATSKIATLTANNGNQALVANNTNTCNQQKNEFVSDIMIAIQPNAQSPSQTVTIQSVELLSTNNTWVSLPVSVTLQQGSNTGWLATGAYGCYSQVVISATANSGSAVIQVYAQIQ